MGTILWLILIVAFVVIEMVTVGLTAIWFAGGALASFILSFFVSCGIMNSSKA